MSDDPENGGSDVDTTTETEPKERRYDAAYLAVNSRSLLKLEDPSVIIGALSADDRKTFTLEQAHELIEKHNADPIAIDGNLPSEEEK